jgi:hypothetical protein
MNVDVSARPNKAYPIRIGTPVGPLLLNEPETRFLVADLQRALEDLQGPYVQVQFMENSSGSYRYTYRDPSGSLEWGDIVEVPTTSQGLPRIAKVVAKGRGDWKGAVKDVTAKLDREVFAA